MKLYELTQDDQDSLDAMISLARVARADAYAPYSRYLVGCVIEVHNGRFFSGCNVECADYDGTHAEEAALAMMVLAGRRDPVRMLCFGALEGTSHKDLSSAPPCGKCRQKLMEFALVSGVDLRILVKAGTGGDYKVALLSELLPWSFGPAAIGVKP